MVKTKHHSEIHIQLFFVFRFELSMVHFVIFLLMYVYLCLTAVLLLYYRNDIYTCVFISYIHHLANGHANLCNQLSFTCSVDGVDQRGQRLPAKC